MVNLSRLGESALFLSVENDDAPLAVQRRIWALAREVRTWRGVYEAVEGMHNLTLFLGRNADAASIELRLTRAWNETPAPDPAPCNAIEIPVRYGGKDGPDLDEVAARAGRSAAEIVALHAGVHYWAYFVGFQPGFAYLGTLDARLHVPRRAHPRTSVARGSVAIAGAFTAVYPHTSPGGWNVIGRTETPLFDIARNPPAVIGSGDCVRFVAIDA